jgi:hypothetical protein
LVRRCSTQLPAPLTSLSACPLRVVPALQYRNEELHRLQEASPGASYRILTTVLTTAMHGEKFRRVPPSGFRAWPHAALAHLNTLACHLIHLGKRAVLLAGRWCRAACLRCPRGAAASRCAPRCSSS